MDPEHAPAATPESLSITKFDRTVRILAQRAGYMTLTNAREAFDSTRAATFIRAKAPDIIGKLSSKEVILGGLAIAGGAAIALAVTKAVLDRDKEWDDTITAGINAKLDAAQKGQDDIMVTPLPDEETLDAMDELSNIFFPDPGDQESPRHFRRILYFVRNALPYTQSSKDKSPEE